jgi:hypothetical protein
MSHNHGWNDATEFIVTRSGKISIASRNAASTQNLHEPAARTEDRHDVAPELISLEKARARTALLEQSLTEIVRIF